VGGAGLLLLAAAAYAALALAGSQVSIGADPAALARLGLPVTGGSIESVSATEANGRTVPVTLKGGRVWPGRTLKAGEEISVEVVMRRPGWVGWLAGARDRERVSLRTPSAVVSDRYLTLTGHAPLRLAFDQPVRRLAYGQPGHLVTETLAQPRSEITLANLGEAGSIEVAAAPRAWERLPSPSLVSWFPAGAGSSAVASPRPGTRITPATPISVTFSQPVSSVLGQASPRLSPGAPGRWHSIDSHTIVFRPDGYGYGLGTTITLGLPGSVRLLGSGGGRTSSVASWTVPNGSTLRAQQILAQLGYLPLRFKATRPVPSTLSAQAGAAVEAPAGSFQWRYADVPGSLRSMWQPGASGVVTRGAVMAFENAHELTTDGELGPAVWRSLIRAAVANQRTSAGYSYVTVNEGSQSLALWHDGSIRLTTAVNTGIASRPTELGTFPVYEHIASGTMSGTNPDGSHYNDPGVPWISYFNGGDALHGFERAQYGFPQSLGCVEMAPSSAGRVWPYTPIGTLVHVE
jgi:hypothetical protein